ncbi:hypothetical protein Afe04nite_38880 [Asanoa ferruginea]|uniref:hypothetical protein n=1 Tax=Asanoa ferruginea TaxID=53367 RepID=UPI001942B8FD|nr:hypothetical protein [Asanoa ferruginea]GIF49349.1 hypothetical protein Afe04nite_38880 [Asanoa ferruginea]
MGTGASEPAEPAEQRRPRPAKAAFTAPPEREERRAPQPRAGDASSRAGKVPPPMLFQAPPEEPVETPRPRTAKAAGDGSARRDGGEQLFTPPADNAPTDTGPAKAAPRPRKKTAAEPATASAEPPAKAEPSANVEPPANVEPAAKPEPQAKKAAPKKAAAAKRTPAARTADQPVDAVKDPAPTETTPKIPAGRKAVAAAPADESSAKAAKKATPRKIAARKSATQKAAGDLTSATTPDHGLTEESVTLNNEAADSPSIAQPTEPVAETPVPATDGIEQSTTEPVAETPAPLPARTEPTTTEPVAKTPTPPPARTEPTTTEPVAKTPTPSGTDQTVVETATETSDLAPVDGYGRAEPVIPTGAAPPKPGPGSLWRVPEAAAAAAVKRFTPQADAWAREIRATYPTATNDGLARLAQQRFIRKTTAAGAAASLANGWSSAADLVATSWVNAELIAHIAAAYGKQATAADLLVLTGVHQDHESAQAAIDGIPGHSASRAPITAAGKTATWAALKILGRWWPGLAAAGGAATATLNTERVAARAIQRFRAS